MGCGHSRAVDGGRAHGGSRRRPRLGGVSAGWSEEGRWERRRRGAKDFHLPNTGLKFTRRQMERLDFKLTKLASAAYEGDGPNGDWCDGTTDEGALALAESSTERLVQRLVCSAGMSDPRFASKFLVPLDMAERRRHRKAGRSLRYLVRLDALSTPSLYPEEEDQGCGGSDNNRPTCILLEGGEVTPEEGAGGRRMPSTPQGFARVRLQGEGVEAWAEFIGQDGYLRSDRIQEHFVHLLSKAASLEASSTVLSSPGSIEAFPPPPPPPPPPPLCPLDVDESMLCGSPGKILDPVTLHHTLQELPPSHQIFYGPAKLNLNRFPDPRDFHITISRSSPHVELLITPLSPSILPPKSPTCGPNDEESDSPSQIKRNNPQRQTITVCLTLGIGFESWPQTADFPYRIPLGHINALHYYQAALHGFYLIPGKPHHTLRCESPRGSVWLMSSPAMELALLSHWCPTQSGPGRSLSAAEALLEGIQGQGPGRKLLGAAVSSTREKQIRLRRVTLDLLYTIHLLHLEKANYGVTNPVGNGSDGFRCWNSSGTSVSMQVLHVLDSMVGALRTQRQRHFMFPRCNMVLLNSVPREKAVTQLRGSKRWTAKARKPRPLPDPALQNKASFWQNAIILSGNLGTEDISSSSEDEDDYEEEEFLSDAAHVESAVRCLHLISSPLGEPLVEDREGEGAEDYQRHIEVEVALTKKWHGALLSLVPTPLNDSSLTALVPTPSSTPAAILSSQYLSSLPAPAYSTRQLKYIQEVIRQLLRVKYITNQDQQNVAEGMGVSRTRGPVEELAFAFILLLDPLNMHLDVVSFCSPSRNQSRNKWWKKNGGKLRDDRRGMRRWKGNRNLFSMGKSKEPDDGIDRRWSQVWDFPGKRMIINKTVNAMIHDRDTFSADLSDDNTFVYYLMKWLIRAKKEEEKFHQSSRRRRYGFDENSTWTQNSRSLKRWFSLEENASIGGGYMARYLSQLFASSLENCIHLEEHLKHEEEIAQELHSFGMWCRLVEERQIFPDEGVYDAHSKGWKWAQSILDSDKTMSSSGLLQLVLAPKPGMSVRQSFNGPKSKNSYNNYVDHISSGSSLSLPRTRVGTTLPSRANAVKAKEFLTLRLQRCQSHNAKCRTVSRPLHCYLRDNNPISKIVAMSHRPGQYRGMGTPVSALIALHKFSVLQEISTLLPEDERQQVLDSIHRVSKVSRRRCRPQRQMGSLSGIGYGKYRAKVSESERQIVDVNENEKVSDGFGTVTSAICGALRGSENSGLTSDIQDQHLDDIAGRMADTRGSLRYLCRCAMGQHQVKGTREVGLAHGVRNFAVLACDPVSEREEVDDADCRPYANSRMSSMEKVTKL
ncbi:uncharacterized protein LOC124158938 isoform X2 [Ischnura elegans]|uniref:uncharacterized protein LOC124158938 isoform X2 n=1 Tax=Ischnura elegans TaxID=197161 RepID=UPI001ED8AEA3|nr:uncharacterized protein LOC124158938 isoform X2 [Ischnura elegans]